MAGGTAAAGIVSGERAQALSEIADAIAISNVILRVIAMRRFISVPRRLWSRSPYTKVSRFNVAVGRAADLGPRRNPAPFQERCLAGSMSAATASPGGAKKKRDSEPHWQRLR